MTYTQKEIREAHERVTKDVESAIKTQKGIALALECQNLVLNHLESIMEEEDKTQEEKEEEEEKAVDAEEKKAE